MIVDVIVQEDYIGAHFVAAGYSGLIHCRTNFENCCSLFGKHGKIGLKNTEVNF